MINHFKWNTTKSIYEKNLFACELFIKGEPLDAMLGTMYQTPLRGNTIVVGMAF